MCLVSYEVLITKRKQNAFLLNLKKRYSIHNLSKNVLSVLWSSGYEKKKKRKKTERDKSADYKNDVEKLTCHLQAKILLDWSQWNQNAESDRRLSYYLKKHKIYRQTGELEYRFELAYFMYQLRYE